MPAAPNIYAEQLIECGYGYPLYYPEPEDDWQMEIGDVGFVKSGAFYRLFSAARDASHPSQRNGVPLGFERFEFRTRPFDPALEAGPLFSHTVNHVGAMIGASSSVLPVDTSFRFKCNSERGAILILETQMKREEAVQHRAREYLRQHWRSIINFAEANNYGPEYGHVMLVIECCKTAAWSSAVYSNNLRDFHVSFTLENPFIPCSPNFYVSTGVERIGPIQRRRSSQRPVPASGQQPPNNQTVFFKAANLAKRQSLYLNLISFFIRSRKKNKKSTRASTGSESSLQYPSSSPDSPSAVLSNATEVPANWELPDFHPAVPLLALAMENSDDDYAIVLDDEWCHQTTEITQLIKDYARFHFEMAKPRAQDLVLPTETPVSRAISASRGITDTRIGDSSDFTTEQSRRNPPGYSKFSAADWVVTREKHPSRHPTSIEEVALRKDSGIDYVSVLNTIGQKRSFNIQYDFQSVGPPHDPLWTSRVSIDQQTYGEGLGKTKRTAKMSAAAEAVKAISEDFHLAL